MKGKIISTYIKTRFSLLEEVGQKKKCIYLFWPAEDSGNEGLSENN